MTDTAHKSNKAFQKAQSSGVKRAVFNHVQAHTDEYLERLNKLPPLKIDSYPPIRVPK